MSSKNKLQTKILLGNEAIALGALHAGVSSIYGYPGTPSTEILEYMIKCTDKKRPYAVWCSNEKTAYEAALGVSMIGKRSLVVMKHVGLNVAADPFINSAIVEIQGGLVVAVADDPGMHSSQNEQDSRFYAAFAKVVCFEPQNQQEAYEMVQHAFDVSENFHIPVLIRLVTRVSHSKAIVNFSTKKRQENVWRPKIDREKWAIIPTYARKLYNSLLNIQGKILHCSNHCKYNFLELNDAFREYGVITAGIGNAYYMENLSALKMQPSHLHIGMYPVPENKVYKLIRHVKKIVVIEEGHPFVEKRVREIVSSSVDIVGKITDALPAIGELTPDNIKPILGLQQRMHSCNFTLATRLPQMCVGCPHIDTYRALKDALARYSEVIVTSDIGCYSLGVLPPLSVIDSLVCMGASIGMANGISNTGFHPVVAVIGDSTFLHSGVTGLIDCVAHNANLTVIILDNSTVAMTGGQKSIMPSESLYELIKGIGVSHKHIKLIQPLHGKHELNVETIKKEIEYVGLSVIIAQRICVKLALNR